MGPVRTPAPFVLLAVVSLAGCGGSSKGTVGGSLPGCAVHIGQTVSRPAPLADFPLPGSGTFDSTREDAAGNTVLIGFVPGTLDAVRDYYKRELPKRGYTIGEGDAEHNEAEADFSGHGAEGHFKLNGMGDCDGAVRLEVALR
jgi:hypothetical protein